MAPGRPDDHAEGLGGEQALRIWTDVLAPATMSVDHPRYLAFIPGAPTEAATLFDLVAGVSSLYGGSWLESSGAVYAENQALRWIADLVGMPAEAGGCFVQGGTVGNLSALVAARHAHARAPRRRAAAAAAGGCHRPDPQLRGLRASRRDGRRPAVRARRTSAAA